MSTYSSYEDLITAFLFLFSRQFPCETKHILTEHCDQVNNLCTFIYAVVLNLLIGQFSIQNVFTAVHTMQCSTI